MKCVCNRISSNGSRSGPDSKYSNRAMFSCHISLGFDSTVESNASIPEIISRVCFTI